MKRYVRLISITINENMCKVINRKHGSRDLDLPDKKKKKKTRKDFAARSRNNRVELTGLIKVRHRTGEHTRVVMQ